MTSYGIHSVCALPAGCKSVALGTNLESKQTVTPKIGRTPSVLTRAWAVGCLVGVGRREELAMQGGNMEEGYRGGCTERSDRR